MSSHCDTRMHGSSRELPTAFDGSVSWLRTLHDWLLLLRHVFRGVYRGGYFRPLNSIHSPQAICCILFQAVLGSLTLRISADWESAPPRAGRPHPKTWMSVPRDSEPRSAPPRTETHRALANPRGLPRHIGLSRAYERLPTSPRPALAFNAALSKR